MPLAPDQRFRSVNDIAADMGFAAAFPNFYEADYGKGTVGGVNFMRHEAVEWRDVPAAELGDPPAGNVPELFRRANDYAGRHGFVGAFPNCHSAIYEHGLVYGIFLVRPGYGEWRDAKIGQIRNANINNVADMMTAAADFAVAQGFIAAFPTFHQARYGTSTVRGHVLLPGASTEWRDIYVSDLEPNVVQCAVILAQFRGNGEFMEAVLRDRDWYQDYFFGRHSGGLSDYYRNATNLRLDVHGRVFGWFDIGHTIAEHESAPLGSAQRRRAHDWAIEAARANGVDVDGFASKVVIVNRHTDFGGVGTKSIVMPHAANSDAQYRDNFHSYMQHEFGHALGLANSYGGDAIYEDPYCIMSFARHARNFMRNISGLDVRAGPGLNVAYAAALGGMPAHRFTEAAIGGIGFGATIGPRAVPSSDAPQAIRIGPDHGNTSTFWVSLGARMGWDRGIEEPTVVVHEVRANETLSRFVAAATPHRGLRAPGDAVTTPDGRFRVVLNAMMPGPFANVSIHRV